MKKIAYLIGAAACCVTLLAGCSGASSLSKNVEGRWAGVPERLFDTDASSATIIETYTFTPSDSVENGGNVTITSLVSVTGAISGAEGITQPVSLTASGYASISGKWTAVSDDKIDLALDSSTLTVNVDPDVVIVSTNVLSENPDTDSATLTNMKPLLSQSISTQLRKAVGERYGSSMTLNDVSVDSDNARMKFKIDKITYTLSRQP